MWFLVVSLWTLVTDEGLQTGPGQHRNTQDDEEALNSIMQDLAALGRCYAQHNSNKPKTRALLYKQDLRVKLEHEREKRIIPFQRPLHIKELVQKVTEAFDQRMDMFYLDREVSLPDAEISQQKLLSQSVVLSYASSMEV
ncbi:unnamed protein product [Boreogadus saida]